MKCFKEEKIHKCIILTGEYNEGSELTIEFHEMEVIVDPDKISFDGGVGRKNLTEACSR